MGILMAASDFSCIFFVFQPLDLNNVNWMPIWNETLNAEKHKAGKPLVYVINEKFWNAFPHLSRFTPLIQRMAVFELWMEVKVTNF